MLNRPKLSVVISPTVNERPASSAWASGFGAKPSRCAAWATRSLVSSRSLPWPLRAFEAVLTDTPAAAARSELVMSGRVARVARMAASVSAAAGRRVATLGRAGARWVAAGRSCCGRWPLAARRRDIEMAVSAEMTNATAGHPASSAPGHPCAAPLATFAAKVATTASTRPVLASQGADTPALAERSSTRLDVATRPSIDSGSR